MYGLSAHSWYLSDRGELLKLGCKQSELEKDAFRWYKDNKIAGFIIIHMDDILMVGTRLFRQDVIEKLTMIRIIGCRKLGSFRCVGLEIQPERNGIRMSQHTCK